MLRLIFIPNFHFQNLIFIPVPNICSIVRSSAVKLESVHPGRTRYLVVVSCTGRQDAEESCLLGIDCHARATVGLVLRVLADTAITLDGDGSALQTLHKVSGKAREQNYFLGGLSHDWVSYYEQRIESDRSCLNEWHAMDNLESKRPPSPDSVRTKPREREETERVIRSTLKEIMMSVDLDEVTSKYIRGRLEEDLDMDLGEFKPFIDQEMLTILGQMDAPTEIFDHVYLGSEWNASNLEELQKNGVRHILNVTREIDNFFPGMFTYLNVRVYDDEKTDLLKHWDNTFKYITKAKMEGSKVLVHCKMGVSRSASVVIAYAMKAYNWDFSQAWKHVKEKRNCIKPNNSFLLQLETYQGILDAMKNKEKLQRSKSDTNLKSPTSAKDQSKKEEKSNNIENNMQEVSGSELKKTSQRPKSWSPNVKVAENMLPSVPLSQSLESIDKAGNTEVTREDLLRGSNQKPAMEQEARNVLMPCDNGQSYSVSQNKIMHLPAPLIPGTPSVKNRISKLETQGQKRKGLVLNLTNQFEAASSKPSSPGSDSDARSLSQSLITEDNAKPVENSHSYCEQLQEPRDTMASAPKDPSGKEVWDPGEEQRERRNETSQKSTEINDNSECLVWTASTDTTYADSCDDNKTDKTESVETSECITSAATDTTNATPIIITTISTTATIGGAATSSTCHDVLGKKARKDGDPFSAQLDRVFDREERRGEPTTRESPSRQSSWSSYDSAVILDNNSVHSSWATLPSRNSSWGSYDMRPSDLLGSSGLFPYDKEEIPWHPGTVKRTKQKLEEGTTAGEVKRVCTQSSTTADDKIETLSTEVDAVTVEAYNPMLLHHMPSPTLRRRDSSPTQEHNLKVETNRDSPSPVGSIDISLTSMRQIGRLSTSAPAPSSLSESDLPLSLRSCRSESETSSPCVVNTTQCPSVKHHKMVLENLCNKSVFNKRCFSVDDSPEAECPRSTSGIVKNLKKEFEAKSTKLERSPENVCEGENTSLTARPKRDVKIRSLPSSPVIPHNESKIQSSSSVGETKDSKHGRRNETTPSSQDNAEDLSVRVLVGKYEVARPNSRKSSDVQLRVHKDKDWDTMEVHPPAKSKIAPEFSRRSAPIMINNHTSTPLFNETLEAPGRPPAVPSPSVVMASVVAKAASKKQQQHGRTHPLARLQVRPRHSSPVYNTM
ncbi:hypothetical protein P5V15_014338 [Pogonomyrmex californicus]